MLLKRIELQGFKSFADKTVIELKDGITAVVGPNGSRQVKYFGCNKMGNAVNKV